MFLDCAGRGGRWNWGEVSIFTHRPNGDEVGDDKSRPVDLLMRGVEYMCATYMRAGSAGASGEDVVNSNDKKTNIRSLTHTCERNQGESYCQRSSSKHSSKS